MKYKFRTMSHIKHVNTIISEAICKIKESINALKLKYHEINNDNSSTIKFLITNVLT